MTNVKNDPPFSKLIARLENTDSPFIKTLGVFALAITLRNFLEPFSTHRVLSSILAFRYSIFYAVHYSIFYIEIAISLILILHWASKEGVKKISRVVLPFFLLLICVPLIDLALSAGRGYTISYLHPSVHTHLWQGFLLLLEPFQGHGISPGQRIEIILTIILAGIYIYAKTQNLLRTVFFTLLCYGSIFFFLALPFVLKIFMNTLGFGYHHTLKNIVRFEFLLLGPLSQMLFYAFNRSYFFAIWKDCRFLRLSYYLLMVLLGFAYSLNPAIHMLFLNPLFRESGIILAWLLIIPSVVFAWLFSVMTNNCADLDIDAICNRNRPLIAKSIPLNTYRGLAWIFLALAMVCSMAVDLTRLMIILFWTINYWLYSCPPFRLKRILFFSKAIIAFNSLLLFALGYSLCTGSLLPPALITCFFLIGFTGIINFIDIKDLAGDQAAGIKTIPTLWGPKRAKISIGIFTLLSYIAIPFIVNATYNISLWMIFLGGLCFLLTIQKDYCERPLLLTHLLGLMTMIWYFWMKSF